MTPSASKGLRRVLILAGITALALLMLYMTGLFTPDRIRPARVQPPDRKTVEPRRTAQAEQAMIPEFFEAVGTVRPMTETLIGAQVSARILRITVRPGDAVQKGDLLLLLDEAALEARLDQTRQGLRAAEARASQARQQIAAAEAGLEQAESHYRRIQAYMASDAATAQDLEQAEAGYRRARAGLAQANDAFQEAESGIKAAQEEVRAARIHLGYARIEAPAPGQVAGRLAEPGDLALPGKPLIILQTRDLLRLEAQVREGLMGQIAVGQQVTCEINALSRTLEAQIQEIVPAADPATRTFVVKADLPPDPDLFPGMFGRLLIPVQERQAVLVPGAALRRVGQLDMVLARMDGVWQEILVRPGRILGDRVEILSGLKGGEILALREERHE